MNDKQVFFLWAFTVFGLIAGFFLGLITHPLLGLLFQLLVMTLSFVSLLKEIKDV